MFAGSFFQLSVDTYEHNNNKIRIIHSNTTNFHSPLAGGFVPAFLCPEFVRLVIEISRDFIMVSRLF